MLLAIMMLSLWNFGAILILTSRIMKLNNHHHGGFTAGRRVQLKEGG